jgi:hypothetical protein
MSVYKASVKLQPKYYEVKHDLGLVFLWIPLMEIRHQRAVRDSVQNWVGNKYDLTNWVQNIMAKDTGYLVIVFQNVSTDKRHPLEVVVSNDDGILELAKVPLKHTRIERLSYAYIEAELEPNNSHRVEIVLQEN